MALIGNYSVLTKAPGRSLGGASNIGCNRTDNYSPSVLAARFGSLAGYYPQASIPDGYRPPATWAMALRSGAMASFGMISGSGTTTTVNLAGGRNASATLTGSGDISTAIGSMILYAVAELSGSGSLSDADLTALGNIQAALDGTGSLDGTGQLAEVLLAVATLAGSGSISAASLGAEAGLVASLSGSGSIDADASAIGSMSATVTLAESGTLTAQAVADAVWAQIIEAGYTADDVLRLLAAANAGKLSGASGSTITIRDLGDTTDRIVATVDASGNRLSITLDPD